MKLPQLEIKVKRKKGDGITYSVRTSKDAAQFFRTVFDADTLLWTEESAMIILNFANEVIGYSKISSGGTHATIIDSKVVFTKVLLSGGHAIILAHNHPSGQLRPSEQDIQMTKDLVKGGNILGIRVLDHIILTEKSHTSMADEGFI
jgi:DNA repair protein RadC